MTSFVNCEQVEKKFGQTEVLRGVNLQMKEGEQCALVGASGSGKSTLLYLLGGLDTATSGLVEVDGRNLGRLDDESLARFRNTTIGFVFQFHFLLPSMNCLDNILLPAKIGGHSMKIIKPRVMELASRLGVEHCLRKQPYEISGGEQQRINIIRALSLKPRLLLCDEPTGNLDSANSQLVSTTLSQLAFEYAAALLVVTHDQQVASRFQRKIVIEDGRIIS